MQTSSNLLGSIPDNPPAEAKLAQEKFDRGVISLFNETKIPRNALKEADNITLVEDGAPRPRPGIDWFGTAASVNAIEGADMYVAPDDSVHLLKIAGGVVYRSLNDGLTWTACTGGSFTVGKKVRSLQANNYFYLFNGYDNIIRYDGTTALVTYTAIASPTGTSVTKTGLAATTYTYRYRVSAVNDVGYTIASVALTIGVDRTRDSWNDTNFVTFIWGAVAGAVRYDIYVGQVAGEETYIDSTDGNGSTTYIDKGQAIEQVAVVAPDSNTTQGPRAADMSLVGTRIYATGDRDYPYRVWISGAGRFIGQFSSAYDATYIDLQKGGQFKPVKVVDYRDGKGTPLATVWCRSKDGRGCIWQGSLDSLTVGNITFPVPNFYRLPGSRGTEAPDSVINVLNDYMYYNEQAFYNLGSRAQFLNLLSTDESSANIRPDVVRIKRSAASNICAHFQNALVYFSVPISSDTNNRTMVFDTERKCWLPNGFTVGFQKFFNYTNTEGEVKLLAWKPGDKRLSEISDSIRGDYGVAFKTSLITGLQHVDPRDRFAFLWAENAKIELAQPSGQINVELSGITQAEGFKKIVSRTIKPSVTSHSWGLYAWSTHKWTDTNTKVTSYSEPSLKRYWNVQEDINAYQFRVDTESLDADYILRTLQINGTATEAGDPREWELFS